MNELNPLRLFNRPQFLIDSLKNEHTPLDFQHEKIGSERFYHGLITRKGIGPRERPDTMIERYKKLDEIIERTWA